LYSCLQVIASNYTDVFVVILFVLRWLARVGIEC